jgi:hypothetical protein
MVAGAAFVVAGAYYLSLDGEGDCAARDESCFRLYDTKGQGLLWIGAGAAAGAAGVALLLLPPAPPAAPGSAAFIPTGVAFRKSF